MMLGEKTQISFGICQGTNLFWFPDIHQKSINKEIKGKESSIYPAFLTQIKSQGNQRVDKKKFFFFEIFQLINEE